jgi:hypothetical protein
LPLGADEATLSMRMQPQTSVERRLVRNDRRQPGSAPAPTSGDRRLGDRRQLPRSRWRQWPSLLASAALGVVVAVLLQSFGDVPVPVPIVLAVTPTPVVAPKLEAGDFSLAEAAALRDAAQRLTPAGVALDEQARLHWTPLRAGLDAAAADPHTPGPVREELDAAREALARVGL